MNFKKLALATAVAAIPSAGFAMEPMEDEALSAVTGQDGIVIDLQANISTNILVEDDGGIVGDTSGNFTDPGAINITGMAVDTGTNDISITIDAGSNTGNTAAQLNVGVSVPANTTITTGTIGVKGTGGVFNETVATTQILSSTTITLSSALNLEINLGAEDTGEAFINLTAADLGTVSMGATDINDADGDDISMAGLDITGLNASGTAIDVETTGLVVNLSNSGLSNVGVEISDLTFGTQPALGDVQISGLDLTGTTVTIYGKAN